ncbi:hypothetical protein [Mucilaginibacter sp. 44-25]|uniref:hypothetical protein n=1 Tax=Mucilaginibacter sp. 44-25 TaxID=1895794 RepID=UPI000963AC8A|nr:hypothetical protein [Mucilaginibacter sp. 44-25]OJW14270.1 MAG: hypothetical protein BGO48_09065 [Mucilaginibacter sp. 44-25]
MKAFVTSLFILASLFFVKVSVIAQPPIKIIAGKVLINDGSMIFTASKYKSTIDSLDKILKINPNDTTSLFYRALFYSLSNNLMARPYQREGGPLENLITGKGQIEKAINLGMSSFKTRVLRAQIYSNIAYRYSGDESWMFNKKQIADRKTLYNTYKDLANRYYDELAKEDENNAWDYQRLKVKGDYPISP